MTALTTKLPTAARIFLGLVFFVFGLNGFLHFIPQPPMSGPPAEFIGALIGSGYLFPLLKVPDTVEVSLRRGDEKNIYFLLNHQNSPVRLQFYKPVHDFLTGESISGKYDLPPHGVLVIDEKLH